MLWIGYQLNMSDSSTRQIRTSFTLSHKVHPSLVNNRIVGESLRDASYKTPVALL